MSIVGSSNLLCAIGGGIAIGLCIGFGVGYIMDRIRRNNIQKKLIQERKSQRKQFRAKKKKEAVNNHLEEFPADTNDFNMPIDESETIQFIDSTRNWEEHKMMLIVRTDIQMSKSKTAAHCGHATLGAYNLALKCTPSAVKLWSAIGQAKVTLKATSEEELNSLAMQAKSAGIPFYLARNGAGNGSKIPDGTPTVLAIGPVAKSRVDPITGKLKLLN